MPSHSFYRLPLLYWFAKDCYINFFVGKRRSKETWKKNLQTAATSNSGHSKKTLLIALSIIAALLILAGAVLAVFIVQQTKFEKQTITLIQNGEYEEASSAVIDKKLSNRQKTALSTAFTNALKDAKIKVVSDLSEAKIQEYQQLKKARANFGDFG